MLEYCEKCFNNANLNHNTCIDTLDNNNSHNIHHNEILSTSTSEQISDNEDTLPEPCSTCIGKQYKKDRCEECRRNETNWRVRKHRQNKKENDDLNIAR